MTSKLFEKSIYKAFAQILFWLCLFSAMNLMFVGTKTPPFFYYRNYIQLFSIAVLVFLNTLVFIPYYFSVKKYGLYVVAVLVVIVVLLVISSLAEQQIIKNLSESLPPPRGEMFKMMDPPRPVLFLFNPKYFFSLIIYSVVVLTGIVIESIQLQHRQEAKASRIENEKLETELKFLKSQTNPHFLFNVLNNVYTLSLMKSEQTPEVVMKLSEMLRYMLYESNNERVSLEKEVQYIKNYVALQQLKDEEPLAVETSFDIENLDTRIAPMILIPFVENAFKHSKIEDTQNGWIKINLKEVGSTITFEVFNSLSNNSTSKDPTGGIGLNNVRRRLELEYLENHRLEIKEDGQQFYICLIFNCLS